MDVRGLDNIISAISSKRMISNCYSTALIDKADCCWENDGSYLISYVDHGVNRLLFFVQELVELERLIPLIDQGDYYLEYITKNPDELQIHVDKSIGCTRLLRLSNSDCTQILSDPVLTQYFDDMIGETATESDTKAVNGLLWDTFYTEIAHLLYDEELEKLITDGKIIVHKSRDVIDAVLQFEMFPRKFYINQIINKSEKNVIHAMLLGQLKKYINNGGKYIYAWVEETNKASLRFHAKYGMRHDGVYNLIYHVHT